MGMDIYLSGHMGADADKLKEHDIVESADPRRQLLALLRSAPKSQAVVPDFPKGIFIARGEKTSGPYTYSQLLEWYKNTDVSKECLVAYDGAPSWVTIEEFIAQVNQSI